MSINNMDDWAERILAQGKARRASNLVWFRAMSNDALGQKPPAELIILLIGEP